MLQVFLIFQMTCYLENSLLRYTWIGSITFQGTRTQYGKDKFTQPTDKFIKKIYVLQVHKIIFNIFKRLVIKEIF